MVQVLIKAASFILIIAIGYLLKKKSFFRAEDFYLISRIVIKITLPAAIISNFSKVSMELSLLLMCALGILCNVVMVGAGFLINIKNSREEKAFDMINLSGYNIGNFTVPFVQSFLGPVGFAATSLFDAGNAVMCTGLTYTAAGAVLGSEKRVTFGSVLGRLFSSVPFDAYIIMTIFTIFRVRLPALLLSVADTVGAANTFLALLMIGIGFELNLDKKRTARLVRAMVMRYGFAVLMSVGLYCLTPFAEEVRRTLAIIVLGPISSISPAYTGALGGDVELASTINSMSIVISVMAMTGALLLLL